MKKINGEWKCQECGFVSKSAGGLTLHMIGKHNYKKEEKKEVEKEKPKEEKEDVENWEFLGKKPLTIKGKTFGVEGQIRLKHKEGAFEVNTKTGELR